MHSVNTTKNKYTAPTYFSPTARPVFCFTRRSPQVLHAQAANAIGVIIADTDGYITRGGGWVVMSAPENEGPHCKIPAVFVRTPEAKSLRTLTGADRAPLLVALNTTGQIDVAVVMGDQADKDQGGRSMLIWSLPILEVFLFVGSMVIMNAAFKLGRQRYERETRFRAVRRLSIRRYVQRAAPAPVRGAEAVRAVHVVALRARPARGPGDLERGRCRFTPPT